MANRLSRFSESFKNSFEESLAENVVSIIHETLDEIYTEKEREIEDMIDMEVLKPKLDISAEKVFTKLKVNK